MVKIKSLERKQRTKEGITFRKKRAIGRRW